LASAKQIAARKKFARIMKSGGFKKKKTKTVRKSRTKLRKTTKVKRKSIQLKRAAPRKRTMVKRRTRYTRSARKGGMRIGSSLKTGIIGEVVKGIGAGSLVGLVMSRVAPNSSITPIASTGAAFLAGGVTGGIAQVVLSGGLSSFGSMFGGASAPVSEVSV
jgi:hypothetical protein|tara:strand:+ start:160 stop:642 length:483 start_codon:yes stop_codon:yes gene_type:complete